jgi:PAS domain S-box-containing protein
LWIDVYFHINISKKNLLISFIPASFILAGLGVKIAFNELNIYSIFYYVLFICFLLIILIDHKHILLLPDVSTIQKDYETPSIFEEKQITDKKIPSRFTAAPQISNVIHIEGIDEVISLQKDTIYALQNMIYDNINIKEQLMEKLEEKTKKLDLLSQDIEDRRKRLNQDEILFRKHLLDSIDDLNKKTPVQKVNDNLTKTDIKEPKSHQKSMLDDLLNCSAILKRGILKQVNTSLINLLGFKKEELLNRSIFDFVEPEGLTDIKEFYIKRLNGILISSYETIFLTKDLKKIMVEVTLEPRYYNKERFEIVFIKRLETINVKKEICSKIFY